MPNIDPGRIAALMTEAQAGIARGDLAAAAAACVTATELDPGEGGAFAMLALVQLERDHLEDAAVAAEQALRLMPGEPALLNLAGAIALRRGRQAEALDRSQAALAIAPYSQRALADQAFLLGELGRSDEAARLLDYKRLVKVAQAPRPAGFDSIRAFNAALAEAISGHPALDGGFQGKTLVDGQRLHDVFVLEPVLAQALTTLFLHAAETYAMSLDIELGHPMAIRPQGVRLMAWANVMPAGGHERPHIHEESWISGVYYAEMPAPDGGDADPAPGAILFGGHDAETTFPTAEASASVLPETGQIILFPSYMHHRTLPFTGDGRRITIAFDILPT